MPWNKMEKTVYTSQFRQEAGSFRVGSPDIERQKFSQAISWEPKAVIAGASRAWRFIRKGNPNKSIKALFFTDWDDTLEDYTIRKERLYADYQTLIPHNVPDYLKKGFRNCCDALNLGARVLPNNGIHPEHYSPLVELVGTTLLLNEIQQVANSDEIPLQTRTFLDNPTEENAREYIKLEIIPILETAVEVKEEDKTYFKEKANNSAAINFAQKPDLVDKTVWDKFVAHMTRSNITTAELENFDLPDDVYWVVTSFGDPSFQSEKILNGLMTLWQNGIRIPNEIVVFTRGRKPAVVSKIMHSLHTHSTSPAVFLDDSLRQFDEMPGVIMVRAIREGAKRAGEKGFENMTTADMNCESLSQILKRVAYQ